MTRWIAILMAAGLFATPALAAETRCGWLQNPTPSNWWLDDADGMWILMEQGDQEGPPGMDRIPDISAGDYVRTNGYHGFACTCMSVDADYSAMRITEIYSVRQLKLSKCYNDRSLSSPQ